MLKRNRVTARRSTAFLPAIIRHRSLSLVSWVVWVILSAGWANQYGRGEETVPEDWALSNSSHRVPVTVHAGLSARQDYLVRWPVESNAMLQDAGVTGVIDTDSFRVVAMPGQGEVTCLFVPSGVAGVLGELRWTMAGQVDALEVRRFCVYFSLMDQALNGIGRSEVVRTLSVRDLSVLSADAPTNLVRNPGFEFADTKKTNAPAEWVPGVYADSQSRIELVSQPTHSGERALKIACLQGLQARVTQAHIPLKPNRLYRLGVWARADGGNTNELMVLRIHAALLDADGNNVSIPSVGINSPEQGLSREGIWERLGKRGLMMYRDDVRTTPNTAYCNLRISVLSDALLGLSAVGAVYVDDVELVEVSSQDSTLPVVVAASAVERLAGTGNQ